MNEASNREYEIEPFLDDNHDGSQEIKREESLSDLKPYIKPLMASFFISLVAGLNDGSIGTIIPRLKDYYNIPNETVSMLFLCSALGFFASAGCNGYIVHKLGQLKTLYLGSFVMFFAFIVLSLGLPFPIMAITMPFVGGGMALLDAAMNVYTANVPLATLMLNILHAVYGLGAMISPLVASFILRHDFSWKFMYIFLTFVALLNIAGITIGFWNVDFNEKIAEGEEGGLNHGALTKKAILNRVTMIAASYVLLYVGVEVTLGGWGYTFLKEGRHGDEIVMARVVSAYWAGLAFGRIVLGYASSRFGEKLMIALFTILIVLNLVLMMISTDVTIDSIALIANGFLLGPMFPTTVALVSKALPRNYHSTSIGFIAALGAGGAALFPFITGQVAGKLGILIMPIACIIMSVAMLALWIFIPSKSSTFEKTTASYELLAEE